MRTKNLTRFVRALMLTAAAVLMTAIGARAGLTPEQQCQTARYAAAGKYAQCQDKATGQFLAGGDAGKMEIASSKCRVKYTATWMKLQKKALGTGSTCDANRFADNGDGTVDDHLTGLQWEKSTFGTSTWVNAYDGILAGGLNDNHTCLSTVHTCLASHCDWRIPTRAELQTILSDPFPCMASPCVDGLFTPTAADYYWTSTIDAADGSFAWIVHFGTGNVGIGLLSDTWSVRAVRLGL